MDGGSDWKEAALQLAEVRPASLLDLDPHRKVRAELRYAGVQESRIRALYPVDFGSLLPHLIACMATIEPAVLLRLSDAKSQAESVLYAREYWHVPGAGGSTLVHPEHIVAYHQEQEGTVFAELKHALRERLDGLDLRGIDKDDLRVAMVLWCAHRFQMHRHELSAEYAAVADALDARVCSILSLAA